MVGVVVVVRMVGVVRVVKMVGVVGVVGMVGVVSMHMSFRLKLNVNFRELKKERHFQYKNFLRALK